MSNDKFTKEESQRRFEAALRGARIAGHKPMSEMRGGQAKPSRHKSPGKRKAVKKTAT